VFGRETPKAGEVWGIGLIRGSLMDGDAAVQWQTWPACGCIGFHDIRWYAFLEFK
jgi:hypothetical protein